ncbi:LLM class flavin-dependent oxidoreductase [Streptomyces violaceus]|uniref:LLM class flavin-dependent oxidoreductase n=1 Tax=Streptomyces violaceus TaxID=1936 RepID=UPI003821CE93
MLYQLLEGSWEENAVLRDRERRVYADPARTHDVRHEGRFCRVNGPHLSEPSPQRTPIHCQAGSSERGREFAARNAAAVFLGAVSPEGARTQVEDVRARAVAHGRDGGDMLLFQELTLIVGSTEEEAERKLADYREHTSPEGLAAHLSGSLQLDCPRSTSTPRSARSTPTACRASCARWWRGPGQGVGAGATETGPAEDGERGGHAAPEAVRPR